MNPAIMVPSRWPASSCMKSPTPSSTGCAIPRRHSQVPGSSRCAAEGKLERPQPRSGEEEVGFIWVACVFPACWSAEWSRKHPSGAVPVRGGHDHVSGTGLLSQMIERGLPAGSCRRSERTQGLAALSSHGRNGGLPPSARQVVCAARLWGSRLLSAASRVAVAVHITITRLPPWSRPRPYRRGRRTMATGRWSVLAFRQLVRIRALFQIS
jgi:hypothetical protein